MVCQEVVRHAAVDVEQHGIASVLTLDEHPLLDTVEIDLDLLPDVACNGLPLSSRNRFGVPGLTNSKTPATTSSNANETAMVVKLTRSFLFLRSVSCVRDRTDGFILSAYSDWAARSREVKSTEFRAESSFNFKE